MTAAPIDPSSSSKVANVSQQVTSRYNGVAAFNAYSYNTTVYKVAAGATRANVIWDDCQGKGYTPAELYDPAYGAHFAQVPIPADAVPAAGTDSELTVWDPAADQLWEFWVAHKQSDGWHACWGGRIDHVSTSPGYFPGGMGATATSLPNVGGMIGIKEAQAGHIDHAISLQLVDTDVWSKFSYPAQRSDGYNPTGATDRVAEGQRLRLDPSVDTNALGLSPIAKMVAVAAQKYGFIITDKSGAVAVLGESSAPQIAATGSDPWVPLMAGQPTYDIFKGFPWSKLQLLPMDYGRP